MKSSVKTEGCFVVLKFEGFIIHQIAEQLENLSTCLPIGPQLCTAKLHGNNNEKPEVQKHRFWAAGSLFYTITKLYFLTIHTRKSPENLSWVIFLHQIAEQPEQLVIY